MKEFPIKCLNSETDHWGPKQVLRGFVLFFLILWRITLAWAVIGTSVGFSEWNRIPSSVIFSQTWLLKIHCTQNSSKRRGEVLRPQASDPIKSRVSRHIEKSDAKCLDVGACVLCFETLQIGDSFHQKLQHGNTNYICDIKSLKLKSLFVLSQPPPLNFNKNVLYSRFFPQPVSGIFCRILMMAVFPGSTSRGPVFFNFSMSLLPMFKYLLSSGHTIFNHYCPARLQGYSSKHI